jgi:MYND finger
MVKTCVVCGRQQVKMKKCSVCKTKYDMRVYFCSRRCLLKDWARHKRFHTIRRYIRMTQSDSNDENEHGLRLLWDLTSENAMSNTVVDTDAVEAFVSIARSHHSNTILPILATHALYSLCRGSNLMKSTMVSLGAVEVFTSVDPEDESSRNGFTALDSLLLLRPDITVPLLRSSIPASSSFQRRTGD